MINIYSRNYKSYLVVPAAAFIAFLFLVLIFPGIPHGIDLKGGTMIIVRSDAPIDPDNLKAVLAENFPLKELEVSEISSPAGYGTVIQYSENSALIEAEQMLDDANSLKNTNPAESKRLAIDSMDKVSSYIPPQDTTDLDLEDTLELANTNLIKAKENFQEQLQLLIKQEFALGEEVRFQKREIGAALGETFWNTAISVSIIAIVLVVIVVFTFFREIIPSLAIIGAAVFDISGALGLMAIFGIPLSLSSIPALLMLIGYSVDTDILLTTRILNRREGTARQRAFESMKTGLTMTLTTLAAVSVMLILSYFVQMIVIFEIAAVLIFGLLADLISTWLMNAPVLLWYAERKESVTQ